MVLAIAAILVNIAIFVFTGITLHRDKKNKSVPVDTENAEAKADLKEEFRENYIKEYLSPIGYKQARLCGFKEKPFRGVAVKVEYGFNDTRTSTAAGFHSFYSIPDAIDHHQEGNVLLEVYNSGKVEYKTKGVESEFQRVLQVILSGCKSCGGRQAVGAWETEKRFDLLCAECSESKRDGESKGAWYSAAEIQEKLQPFSETPIVVSYLTSTDQVMRFIPTNAGRVG